MYKVFYININDGDETGMHAISLVDYPAVERNFLCFDKDEKLKLELKDESKHVISGVVALADTPIYRYNKHIGEYWVVFTKETIRKMIEKYSKSGLFNSVNLSHQSDQFVDKVFMIESYIIDKERGIVPKGFEDVPDGSWICSFKVDDNELWDEIIKTDKYNGFSLEGVFELVDNMSQLQYSEEKDEMDKLIKSCLN